MSIGFPAIFGLPMVCMYLIAANCRPSSWVSKLNVVDSTTSHSQDQVMTKFSFFTEFPDYFQKNVMAPIPQFKLLFSK